MGLLPKIETPTYEVKLPSTGQEITIRPFLVKEEKLLLMASESGDDAEIIRTVQQIVNNCILSENIDVSKLPFFDVDYLFIALRAKSVGESIDIKFTCGAMVEEKVCGAVFPAKIDIANVETHKPELNNPITLSGKLAIKMKYPTYAAMKTVMDTDSIIDKNIHIIVSSIDQIVDGPKVITLKDISKEELVEFVEGLTKDQFSKLEHWVLNFPSFSIKSKAKCTKCGFEHQLSYNDFISFFE